jgi:hypothetical protein
LFYYYKYGKYRDEGGGFLYLKRKIYGIGIGIFMMVSLLLPMVSSNDPNHIEHIQDISSWERDLKCDPFNEIDTAQEYFDVAGRYPVMKEKIFLDDEFDDTLPITSENGDIPDEFSWREYNGEDWTSPITDQGPCGSCWLFAAVGGLECILNLRENTPDLDADLSEQYVMSCLPRSGSCEGGWPEKAFEYILRNDSDGNYRNGIILEECFPYQAVDPNGCNAFHCNNDPVTCDEKCRQWEDQLVPILDYGKFSVNGSSEAIERIQTMVMEFGPVVTYMAVTSEFGRWISTHHGPDDYFPYRETPKGDINHCIVIVGWKNDPSIEHGGYWIIKNSWGESPGYDGFFNIEYNSLWVDTYAIVWVDYDPNAYEWLPVVYTGGPYHADVGEDIVFDGSKTRAYNTNIVSYQWDFGDGTTVTEMTATHVYAERGIYPVTLTVTDDENNIVSGETAALIEPWSVGNSWIYNIHTFEMKLDITFLDLLIEGAGALQNLELTVTDEDEDSYTLGFEGEITGNINLVNKFMKPGVMLRSITLDGDMVIDKSTLGIKQIIAHLKGRAFPLLGRIPVPVLLPFEITVDTEVNKVFEYVNFPLKTDKKWFYDNIAFTMKPDIDTAGLNIFKLMNRIANLLNMTLFPPEGFSITFSSLVFKCVDMQSIFVEAGTYEAYQLSFKDIVNYYYSPSAGNVIKISTEFEDFVLPFIGSLSMKLEGELISTNYE